MLTKPEFSYLERIVCFYCRQPPAISPEKHAYNYYVYCTNCIPTDYPLTAKSPFIVKIILATMYFPNNNGRLISEIVLKNDQWHYMYNTNTKSNILTNLLTKEIHYIPKQYLLEPSDLTKIEKILVLL